MPWVGTSRDLWVTFTCQGPWEPDFDECAQGHDDSDWDEYTLGDRAVSDIADDEC